MCCWTHDERDERDKRRGIDVLGLLASSELERCRCGFGDACRRAAVGESMLCAWCAELDPPGHTNTDMRHLPRSGHQRYCENIWRSRMFGDLI